MENNKSDIDTPNTNNFLNWVEIKNFKSIKDLRLDCKRVNVFIGKPNVGKSNILEGLGLLGANLDHKKYLNGAVRYSRLADMFLDKDSSTSIKILTDKINATLSNKAVASIESFYELNWSSNKSYNRRFSLDDKGRALGSFEGLYTPGEQDAAYELSPVRKYDFKVLSTFESNFSGYLLPPHGWNLYAIVSQNPELWSDFIELFREQNLKFVLLDSEQTFALSKEIGGRVKQYEFSSIADTFRRFMFYITAIESNKNSVIVFEEPEVHSFPPYTQEMAYRMIYDEDNQYFISTHSPYLLHTFIENLEDSQLNVFITYYENYETKVHALTTENLRDILDFGTDVFFNLDKFIPNAGRPISA